MRFRRPMVEPRTRQYTRFRPIMDRRSQKNAPVMPRTSPWYSAKESYHHDNTACGPGSEILRHNRIAGTGGKPLCPECAKLDFAIPENLPGHARQK